MIIVKDKKQCCGCTACANVCPKNCITMSVDEEGFQYPKIDLTSCVNCGLCEKVCPCLNAGDLSDNITEGYIGQYPNEDILDESTSGGAFSAIAEYVSERKGAVVGAVFDADFNVKHDIFVGNSWEGVRNSKYAQSDLSDVFSQIKKYLDLGTLVLFSGTPCQIAGLKNYLRKDYENLITVDIICRSIPSPLLWDRYKEFLEKKYRGKLVQVKFRNKTYGYHNGTFLAKFDNGKTLYGSNRVNPYMKAFHKNVCSRPSCYDCKFKSVARRSDITIFDCWKPDEVVPEYLDNNKGSSGIIVHTEKGKKIVAEISTKMSIVQADVKKLLAYTGGMAENSIEYPKKRESFYIILNEQGLEAAINECISITMKDRIIEYVKAVLYRTKILGLVKNILHK